MPDRQLPMFAKLGYGYDIVTGESKSRLFAPRFARRNGYTFRGTRYEVPEGVEVEPGPESIVISTTGVTIQKQIHDFQTTIGMSMGVKLESFGEFSRTQKIQERLGVFTTATRYFADTSGSFGFFKIRLEPLRDGGSIDEKFLQDARDCSDADAFQRSFVDFYGTHVVTEGTIGGDLNITLDLDVEKMKQSLVSDSELGGQISAEIEGIPVNGSMKFDVRATSTDENYRSHSTRTVRKTGGDVTASSPDEWQASLKDASLPEMDEQGVQSLDGPLRRVDESLNHGTLAFKVSRIRPVSSLLLGADKEVAEKLDGFIKEYLIANKVDSTRRMIDPLVGGGGDLHMVKPGGNYHCAAWAAATTGVKFGLKAYPGVKSEVRIWHPLAPETTVPLWAGESHDASGFYGPGNIWIYCDCDEPSARLKVHVW